MGIVNAGQLAIYDELPEELRDAVEDVILNRNPDATENLLNLAPKYAGKKGSQQSDTNQDWRKLDVNERLNHSLVSGVCLLYTSPSPRDRTRSRMPSSA